MFLFGKVPTPEERVRTWKRELKRQERIIERSIREIEREEQKVKREIKMAATKKEYSVVRILAKQIVQSRKAKERLYKSKAELNSVSMLLSQQLATLKVSGCLAKSAQVMGSMNRLVKVGPIMQTIQTMQREMEKAGMIEEMVEDMWDDEEVEEEAEEEVNKVIDELTAGMVPAPITSLPTATETVEISEEDKALEARLKSLSS
ncbi:Vacuolar protein-sorting-associated protein 24 [Balamuthia mandrillaris]